MAPLAAAIARVLGARLWLQLHGIEAWERPSAVVRKAAEQAALITSVSRYTRHRFLEWAEVDPPTVRVLPNTVGRQFTPGPKPSSLLQRHDLQGRKVILTVARLSAEEQYKGHDRVIRALPEVIAHHPEIAYIVVGDGGDRPRLEAFAETTGVREFVHFVGNVAGPDLLAYYRLADLFVMPSTGEGFGIVFIEALAAGVTVIGGNRDGSIDALAEGEMGTLVDPEDGSGLAAAMVEALNHEGRRPIDFCNPHRFVMNNFVGHVNALLRSLH
jgi:phosphatidylinositol alpha-1,6-mannosyltransferase